MDHVAEASQNSQNAVIVAATTVPVAAPRQADSDQQAVMLWLHGKSRHSQRAYRLDYEKFATFAGKPLSLVTVGDLQAFADSLADVADTSRKRTLNAVKSLLTFSHKIGYTRFNVGTALTVRKPKNRLAERIMSQEDVLRLIVACVKGSRNHALLSLLYDAGLRVSELCGLTWRDVQPREGGAAQITVYGKGDKTRHVMISTASYKAMLNLKSASAGADDPVFPSKSGKRLDQPRVFRILRAAAKRAGVEGNISPHWFRHACASHAIDAGAPISLVQQQLGHSSLEITGGYLHARPTDGLCNYLRR